MNGSPTFRERQVRFGRKVCEAKELIRKVAAPGSAGGSLVKPFEPRRPGGQVSGNGQPPTITSAASAGDG
jgi:hypothetical protein